MPGFPAKPVPAGEPEREVAAGGMAGSDQPAKVETVAGRVMTKRIGG